VIRSEPPRLWDISAPILAESPVFPGDTPYRQTWAWTLADECPVNVSAITLSPHVGTHADAPLHYNAQGLPSGALDLHPYLGRCRIIHALDAGPTIGWADVAHAVDDELPERVLVRTYRQHPGLAWDPELRGLSVEVVEGLADRGVRLVGIDTASVDPADSKSLDAHQALRRRDLRVLENLILQDIAEGDYELIALPLKLMSADASPVRAILREMAP